MRRRRCDHCDRLKDPSDLIEGYNYFGNPMRVCGLCIENQRKTVRVAGWMGLIAVAAIYVWHLFLSAQTEEGRQLFCDGFRKAAVWCKADEQISGGFQVHTIPGAR